MAFAGIAEGLAAAGAGYSSSTTQTNSSYNGYSNSYGNAYAYGSGGMLMVVTMGIAHTMVILLLPLTLLHMMERQHTKRKL